MTTQNDLALIWANSGGVSDPGSSKYATGWVAEKPTYQNFNYVLKNLTGNILSLAEGGTFDYETTITYKEGARVLEGGIVYTCIATSTGNLPSTSQTHWTKGIGLGVVSDTLLESYGLHLKDVSSRLSATTWDSSDITVEGAAPLINLITNNGASKNWLLGNVTGELVAVDIGTDKTPDGRSTALAEATTHRLYHEGHKPTQSEVDGTIPANPIDGVRYARLDNSWVIVTSNTVSTAPPPASTGSGQGWYNLEDGQQYVDIDDGDSSQWVLSNPPIIPDGGSAWTPTTLDQETVDGIGTIRIMQNTSGSGITANTTVAGSALTNISFDGAGNLTSLGAPSGSWKQVIASGQTLAFGSAGHFVRVA